MEPNNWPMNKGEAGAAADTLADFLNSAGVVTFHRWVGRRSGKPSIPLFDFNPPTNAIVIFVGIKPKDPKLVRAMRLQGLNAAAMLAWERKLPKSR